MKRGASVNYHVTLNQPLQNQTDDVLIGSHLSGTDADSFLHSYRFVAERGQLSRNLESAIERSESRTAEFSERGRQLIFMQV